MSAAGRRGGSGHRPDLRTVVFGGIQTNITSTNFGRVSSQANTPRVAQLKVRLEF